MRKMTPSVTLIIISNLSHPERLPYKVQHIVYISEKKVYFNKQNLLILNCINIHTSGLEKTTADI